MRNLLNMLIPATRVRVLDPHTDLMSREWYTFFLTTQNILMQMLSIPVTKTANFTVSTGETWLINNKTGSTCVVTLPSAADSARQMLHFQNYQAQNLVSSSSNVVPKSGGAAGTAILPNVAGSTATLISDGVVWRIVQ